jgi:hypothetical protein
MLLQLGTGEPGSNPGRTTQHMPGAIHECTQLLCGWVGARRAGRVSAGRCAAKPTPHCLRASSVTARASREPLMSAALPAVALAG